MQWLQSPGGTWELYTNDVFEAQNLRQQVVAGEALIAEAQAQESRHLTRAKHAAASPQRAPCQRGTPVHLNFTPTASPPARDLERLKLLSAGLRESLYANNQCSGGGGANALKHTPRSRSSSIPRPALRSSAAPRQHQSMLRSTAAALGRAVEHSDACRESVPSPVQIGAGVGEVGRVKELEAALVEERRRCQQLHQQLARQAQNAALYNPEEQPAWTGEGGRDCRQVQGGEREGDVLLVPPQAQAWRSGVRRGDGAGIAAAVATTAAAEAAAVPSAFSLRGFRDRLRRLEAENSRLRQALGWGS